jgi:hypothetical protein
VLRAIISAYGVINHWKTFSFPSYISGVSNSEGWGAKGHSSYCATFHVTWVKITVCGTSNWLNYCIIL